MNNERFSTVDIINNIYEWFKIGQSPTEIINNLQLMSCDKKQEDEWKEIEEMEDCDFRVGDKVFCLLNGNGIISGIRSGDGVITVKAGNGSMASYYKDGTIYKSTKKRSLYHGHNLKVTVEEKKPKRTVERWLMAYLTPRHRNNRMTLNLTEQEAISEAAKYQDDDFIILAGPIKVQIPV